MHYSAKRGLAIACRLFVCLTVCPCLFVRLCRWWIVITQVGFLRKKNSWLLSLGCSLSADPNIGGLLQWEHLEILAQNDPLPVDLSVGDIRSQIAAEWLQIAQRS